MQPLRRRRLKIAWHRGLIPISLFFAFILKFAFNAPIWVLLLFCAWIPFFYLGYPWYLKYRWNTFEKQFHIAFQREDYKSLLDLYKKQYFLRRCGPKSEMLSKLGLVYSAMGKHREAEYAYEQAIYASPDNPPDQLCFNLANTKFELGKYDDARQIYQSLRENLPYQQSIRTQLALINLYQGVKVDEARAFLEQQRPRSVGIVRARIDQAFGQFQTQL